LWSLVKVRRGSFRETRSLHFSLERERYLLLRAFAYLYQKLFISRKTRPNQTREGVSGAKRQSRETHLFLDLHITSSNSFSTNHMLMVFRQSLPEHGTTSCPHTAFKFQSFSDNFSAKSFEA